MPRCDFPLSSSLPFAPEMGLKPFPAGLNALPASGFVALSLVGEEDTLDMATMDGLAKTLGASSEARLARFSHAPRRAQSLRVRLMAKAVTQKVDPTLEFVEVPPESPRLEGEKETIYTSLAHTVGVVGAALSIKSETAPQGRLFLDCEVMRPKTPAQLTRLLSFMAEGLFLEPFKAFADNHNEDETLAFFYSLWGAYECCVKANHRYGLSMTERFIPRVVEEKGRVLIQGWDKVRRVALPLSLLTIPQGEHTVLVSVLDTVEGASPPPLYVVSTLL